MTDVVSLLPSNSTPWEVAQSLTSAERRQLPTEIIREVWNPETCPVELLPYLAWGLGLEIWKDEWPESKKRNIVSRIWQLKRRKTTPQGIKDYVNLVDADIAKFVRPRDKMWWVPSMSAQERATMMAKMPEIRVYPNPPVATASSAQGFYSFSFWNASVTYPDDAMVRWLDRAVFRENGQEARVTVAGLQNIIDDSYTISLRYGYNQKAFYNHLELMTFRIPSDASDHILAVTPKDNALTFAVPPGLIPTSVRPEPKADVVNAPVYKAFHWPSFYNYSFRIPSDADIHLYSSLRFIDPKNIGKFGKPMSFWGWSRSSIAAYTAELTIEAPVQKPIWSFASWWGVGFWNKQDLSMVWDSLEAITISQAARDDIWASLQLYQRVQFSAGLRFGEFNFGDDRKVV